MARYVILRHEDTVPPGRRPPVRVIRDGWSWPAFLLPLPWLLWHRLWLAALVVLAASVAIALIAREPGWAALGLPLNLLLGLYVGLEARNWLVGRDLRRNYRLADIVRAYGREEAELRFAARQRLVAENAPRPGDVPTARAADDGNATDMLFASDAGAVR